MKLEPKLKSWMDRYDDKFYKFFEIHPNKFIDEMLYSIGIIDFDIVKFDQYLHGLGYIEQKDGSMNDYIEKNMAQKRVI